jgi:hypothetical protein
MAEQVPSIGRVVHFVYGDVHVPAIIIDPAFEMRKPEDEGGNEVVQSMVVFTMIQGNFHTTARYSADPIPGTWHWPEYVPAKD